MKKIITFLAAATFATGAFGVDGAAVYKKCVACHGAKAETKYLGKIEPLRTMSAAYIEETVTAYKEGKLGKGKFNQAAIMKLQTAKLTGEDIKAVASYIASLATPATPASKTPAVSETPAGKTATNATETGKTNTTAAKMPANLSVSNLTKATKASLAPANITKNITAKMPAITETNVSTSNKTASKAPAMLTNPAKATTAVSSETPLAKVGKLVKNGIEAEVKANATANATTSAQKPAPKAQKPAPKPEQKPEQKPTAEVLQKLCDEGTSSACAFLGVMYETGSGVAADSKKAAELYEKATKLVK